MSEIISHKNPKSIIAESIKILRTNLQYMYGKMRKGRLKSFFYH